MSESSPVSPDRPDAFKRRLCAAILVLEAFVLGLTTLVMISVVGLPPAQAMLIGLGLAVLCVLASGLLRFTWAYALGWLIQVAALALGFVTAAMFALGVIFLALWATAYFLGIKIDRERADAYATYAREHQTGH